MRADDFRRQISALYPGRPVKVMHVCGTHENVLCRHGLRAMMPHWLRLVAGPGCPVCICPASDISLACRMAKEPGITLCTFGDVVRVPSGNETLFDAKALGADVRVVYSVSDALDLARSDPKRLVVFFAVGFETTACTTAAALLSTPPKNFLVLCSHRLIPPALEALLALYPDTLDGFLLPGHVSTVIGSRPYEPLALKYNKPMVVAGFEPEDIFVALRSLLELVLRAEGRVENAYARAVRPDGNTMAKQAMAEVFEPCDAAWRGIGVIKMSGFRLKPAFKDHDACARLGLTVGADISDFEPGCLCGEVLVGQAEPEECPFFGSACTPLTPIGPCMVGAEGTCHVRATYSRWLGYET